MKSFHWNVQTKNNEQEEPFTIGKTGEFAGCVSLSKAPPKQFANGQCEIFEFLSWNLK